jgi:hypothetical protein
MSGHAQKFGGSFPQIFVVKFEKMKVVRKTPEFSKKVKISCIYKFLVVGNPQKLVPFLTVITGVAVTGIHTLDCWTVLSSLRVNTLCNSNPSSWNSSDWKFPSKT